MTDAQKNAPPQEQRILCIDGNTASKEHLTSLLRHLNEFGTGRLHSIAYALFPARTQTAAITAAKRCVANAVKLKLVDYEAHPKTQHRFYALTRAGAAHLKKMDPSVKGAISGIYLLRHTENGQKVVGLNKATHREWTTLLTVWGRLRKGLATLNERQLLGNTGNSTGITRHYMRAPDALTFDTTNPNAPTVVWHEVELSRRSQWTPEHTKKRRLLEEQTSAPVKTEGYASWIDLLDQVRRLRTVDLENVSYDIKLMIHCGTPQIKNTLKAWTRDHFQESPAVKEKRYDLKDYGDYMTLNFGTATHDRSMSIIFVDLPKLDDVWHDSPVFPFFDAANRYDLNEHAAQAGEQVMANPRQLSRTTPVEPVQTTLFDDTVPDMSFSLRYHHGRHVVELPEDGSEDEY